MYQSSDWEWLVLHESNVSSDKGTHTLPKFTRVRKVTLDCDSCGRTNEYLIPCEHIYRVVGKEYYFGPEQFHIRWNRDFCYFYNTEYGKTICPTKISLLVSFLKKLEGIITQQMNRIENVPWNLPNLWID